MYDSRTLKPARPTSRDRVECPVLNCSVAVERQRLVFRRENRFRCPDHRIYISPSTFDHEDYRDNLLISDSQDLELLGRVFAVKRETDRLGRERSEDALTFNVFRSLERQGLLDTTMSAIAGGAESDAAPSYWSFCLEHHDTHPLLADARAAFGETDGRGSEPDLIVETARTLFVVEAKLDSRNETTPSRPWVLKTYHQSENGWYESVLRTEPSVVAQELKLYQLMRLWLLGTWMASRAGKQFVLVSLTPESREQDIVDRFAPHIVAQGDRKFVRFTWERIRELVRPHATGAGLSVLVEYLDHKTLGYDASGKLRKAFQRGGLE